MSFICTVHRRHTTRKITKEATSKDKSTTKTCINGYCANGFISFLIWKTSNQIQAHKQFNCKSDLMWKTVLNVALF